MAAEDEVRVIVARDDDDNSSVSSFDSFGSERPSPRSFDQMPKVDGKAPDVLYAFRFYGRYERLIEERLSTQPFKRVPEHPGRRRSGSGSKRGEEGEEEGTDGPKKEPVLEIVYSVDLRRNPRPPRGRPIESTPPERPITSAFDGAGYHVEHAYSDDEDVRPNDVLPTPSMIIHSKHLLDAIKAVVQYYPNVYNHDKVNEIKAPYTVLYHHRRELAEYRDNQPASHTPEQAALVARHIDVLLKFLDEAAVGRDVRREEERHKQPVPVATFDYFWLLLKPGSLVYAKVADVWEAFVISKVSNGPPGPYSITCWYLESNGQKVSRFMTTFTAQCWLGEQAISNLPVVPEAFWKEDLAAQGGLPMRENMVKLGKMYWELLKRPTYMEHDGVLVNSATGCAPPAGVTGFMSGRVICDVTGFDMYYDTSPVRQRRPIPVNRRPLPPVKDPLPNYLPRCVCEACTTAYAEREQEVSEHGPFFGFEDLDPLHDSPPSDDVFYMVCKKTIPGFILGYRHWGHLRLSSLRPVSADKDAFKYLVLDDELKLTVRALIGKYATAANGTVSPWGNDFVKNKGEGRIFLLHGTPGVGKTCTAECIAELTSRPLISLTSGDLGVNNLDVEDNLNYFLELGQRYGALVLLDEADVYLERRHGRDIWRNGLVSIFLRALEYYRGVLFLTTNRVQSFDTAFLSRIHVALHYKSLSDEDRERIWLNNFERLERDSAGKVHVSSAARDFVWSSPEVNRLQWNGREIRNAMQTALALAEYDASDEGSDKIVIGGKHIKAVVKMSKDFRDFMQDTQNKEDPSRPTLIANGSMSSRQLPGRSNVPHMMDDDFME